MDIGIAARRCYGVYMKWILGRMRWYLDSNLGGGEWGGREVEGRLNGSAKWRWRWMFGLSQVRLLTSRQAD